MIRLSVSLALIIVAQVSPLRATADSPLESLYARIDWSVKEIPLETFVAQLRGRIRMPVFVDHAGLTLQWIDPNEVRCSNSESAPTVARFLDQVLAPQQLSWFYRDQSIVITTPSMAAEVGSDVRLYQVTRKVAVDRRIGSIQANAQRESWKVSGGNGDIAAIPPKWIVILQSPKLHQHVARSFRRSIQPVEPLPGHSSDWRLELTRKGIHMDLAVGALAKHLQRLSRECGFALRIDQNALNDAGIDLDSIQIWQHAGEVTSVRAALDHLLPTSDRRLGWYVDDDAIMITSIAAMKADRFREVYEFDIPEVDFQPSRLVEAIEYTISPETWEFNGGNGTIEINASTCIVNQSRFVHQQLHRLFEALQSHPPEN